MKNKGFTLFEILLMIVIIGALASIAIPNYQKAIEKSRKVEASNTLASIWAAEKRYHLDFETYTNSTNNLDIKLSDTSLTYYNYSISSANSTDFLAAAEKKDKTYYLTINTAGEINEYTGYTRESSPVPVGVYRSIP